MSWCRFPDLGIQDTSHTFIHSVYSLVNQMIKNLPAMQETQVQFLGQEDPLGKGVVTHSSTLAWRIPWTEEPGRLESMGLQGVWHDWATNTSTFLNFHTPQSKCSVNILFPDLIHYLYHLPQPCGWFPSFELPDYHWNESFFETVYPFVLPSRLGRVWVSFSLCITSAITELGTIGAK